jgi:SAM-dependent methyltransferase
LHQVSRFPDERRGLHRKAGLLLSRFKMEKQYDERWIADYFDEAYLAIYRDGLLPEEMVRGELELVQEYFKPSDAPLVDLACGYGRHAIPLAKAGYQMVGVDINGLFLETAHQDAEREGVSVEWLESDMRNVPLDETSAAGVLLLFNSLGYFGARELYDLGLKADSGDATAQAELDKPYNPADDPNLPALQEAHRLLKERGRLFLDVAHRPPLEELIDEQPHMLHTNGEALIEEQFELQDSTGVLRNQTRFQYDGKTKETGYFLKVYQESELHDLLKAAGFVLYDLLGDYDGEPFDEESARMIVVAQKQ